MKKLAIGLTVGMMLGSAATAFAAEDIGKEIKAVFTKFNFKINGMEAEKAAKADTQFVDYSIRLMDLNAALGKKNYSVGDGGASGDKTTILINGKEYKLQRTIADGHTRVDIRPLIDAKLITLEEAKALSEEVRKEREKALGTSWEKDVNLAHLVKYHDLYFAIEEKYSTSLTSPDLEGSWTYHNGYEGWIKLTGEEYKLKAGPKEILDMTPLIEANVITLEEVKDFQKRHHP
ncbi:hypothetical protein QJ48_11510 [Paenibacillus sp. A3]|uniref:hypothetical protein n=1 Tax=Paenibacillus sp. A3 TaxID=1337054 RepID=UPI0006D5496F|nr:hypothetical protein [Paenibacillus sp. A3]KPV59352.1 hypothetical protein QJ48_11510 [Paenibacillus sp. A3]